MALVRLLSRVSGWLNRDARCGPVRRATSTGSGAVTEEPPKTPMGMVKLLLTVLPGLWIGATISKTGAAFLEENDIFVPSDDDDDEEY